MRGGTQARIRPGIFKDLGDPRGCGNALFAWGRYSADRLISMAQQRVRSGMGVFGDLEEREGEPGLFARLGIDAAVTARPVRRSMPSALGEALSITRHAVIAVAGRGAQ